MTDLRKAIGEKTTENLLCTVHHVPICDDLCLFRTFVPDGAHDEERRLADGFENTKQSTDTDQSRKTEAKSMASENGTPCENVETKVLCDRHTLDDPVGRIFDNQDSNVNTRSEPAPLNTH